MTDINDMKLAKKLFGTPPPEELPGTNYRYEAEARSDSSNGTVLVAMSGETVSEDGEQAQLMPVANCSVLKGQIVTVTVTDGKPVVTDVIGWGDNIDGTIVVIDENAKEALEAAETAEDAAAAAQAAAEQAQYDVETMSSYFIVDETGMTGAYIASTANDFNTGANVRVYSGGLQIRNGTTVLASFTASQITIGQQTATISLCGGQGIIRYISNANPPYIQIFAKNTWVTAEDGEVRIWSYYVGGGAPNSYISVSGSTGITIDASGAGSSIIRLIGTLLINSKSLLDWTYPVGAVYVSYVSTSPASLFGGTWTAITGRFPYFNAGTAVGGSNTQTHTLSAAGGAAIDVGNTGDALFINTRNANVSFSKQYGNYVFGDAGTAGETNVIAKALLGNTDSASNMPAYQTLYAWRRTA